MTDRQPSCSIQKPVLTFTLLSCSATFRLDIHAFIAFLCTLSESAMKELHMEKGADLSTDRLDPITFSLLLSTT
jgi:hypothetical protein